MGKSEVLHGGREFRLVFTRGDKIYGRLIRAAFLSGQGAGGSLRIGVSVPKNVGIAVRRNRVKRLIREAARREKDRIRRAAIETDVHIDIVFQFRSPVSIPLRRVSLQHIAPDLQLICEKIVSSLKREKL